MKVRVSRTESLGGRSRDSILPRRAVLSGLVRFGMVLAGIVALASAAQAQISLSTVVAMAQRNSSGVKLAQADVRKAAAELSEINDAYIPNLDIGSSVGPPTIGFPAGQPSIANATMASLVFSFSQQFYSKAAEAAYRAARLSLKDAAEQAALDAANGYLELDTVTRELAAAAAQEQDADRLRVIEEQRVEAGVDAHSDLLQSRLTQAELHLKQIQLGDRAAVLRAQLATMTGLPAASIQTLHDSIPTIPAVTTPAQTTAGLAAAQENARSRQLQARGDELVNRRPRMTFGAQYNRDSNSLNNYSVYFQHFKADNFSIGLTIQIPLFDLVHRDKSRESAADALKARVEAEQASRQNDVQVATLDAQLAELAAQEEIASLKQEIAQDELRQVQSEMQYGNGSGAGADAAPQVTPKALEQARIEEETRQMDADETGLNLNKARLGLLRALGHMQDWLATLREDAAPAATTVSRR